MKKKSRAVAQTNCLVVRDCGNESCIFKMLFRGYKDVPRSDMEKRRNAEMERMNGKGYFPDWRVVGHGETADLICDDFQEKRT